MFISGVIAVFVAFALQPPSPSGREVESAQPNTLTQPQQAQPNVLIGAEGAPAVVRITKSQEEAAQEQADRDREATTQRWTIGLTIAIAVFTGLLVLVGWKQRQTYEATLVANKIIERAYVKMAHAREPRANPNGGRFDFVTPTGGNLNQTEVWFKYGLTNCGRTPCNVLGGGIWYVIDTQHQHPPIAPIPPQRPIRVDPTFLVPDMTTSDLTVLFIDTTTINNIRNGTEHIWLLGYVDYRDRFGNFHRAGYGRRYDHYSMDLVFDRTTGPFNYDEPLTKTQRKQYES